MSLNIISPGPLTTVQDLGRIGYMAYGFSQSGVMDQRSAKTANILVGNDEGEAVLEMTMAGIRASFDEDNIIAVTGADFSPKINGKPVNMYCAVSVRAGDELSLSAAKNGCRAYLSVAGGFDIPEVMGSRSTNLKCSIGGFEGRKLIAGDKIPLRHPRREIPGLSKRKVKKYDIDGMNAVLRVVLGPQDDYFGKDGIETFLKEVYTVTGDSDRMGIKFEGMPIESKQGVDIISDGIAFGSVQIPSSGKPIIMMADRQTTGGYAKIATVIGADLPKLAQMKPFGRVCFDSVSVETAQKLSIDEKNELEKLKKRFLKLK